MIERRREPRLAGEALAEARVGGVPGGDHLDRHLALEARLLGAVHDAHAAAAEQLLEPEAADLVGERRQRGLGGLLGNRCRGSARGAARVRASTPMTPGRQATSGCTTGTIRPVPNSSLGGGKPGHAGEAALMATAASGRTNAAASGPSAAMSTISAMPTMPPGERSGRFASTVAMALPWTSGPDISDPSVVEVVDVVLQPERLGPHDHDLVLERRGWHASAQHLRIRVGRHGCGGPA